MEIIFGLLFCAAFLWILVIAIQGEQWGWTIGMFFIAPLIFIYGVLNWDRAKKPFLLAVASIVFIVMFVDPATVENY